METTNNLPSFFASLRVTKHSPLISTAELERLILYDKALEENTKSYRKAQSVDTKMAYNTKRLQPAICPSVQFRRTGRKLEDFGCATGWLMLDYDHVAEIGLDEKVEISSRSPYSMVVYRTISGKGLRILLRYERPKGCTLTITELHRLAVDKAISIYDDLLHISADQQCKDMVRLCGLAHDAKAYFCWHLYAPGERYKRTPDVKDVRQWLSTRLELRRNTITDKTEMRGLDIQNTSYFRWTIVDDPIENSIFSWMDLDGLKIPLNLLDIVLNSDFVRRYNPLTEFLESLPEWKEGDPDYIGELSRRVVVKNYPTHFHTQQEFTEMFRKWIVGMVACWVSPRVVNEMVLILVGKGGLYKTSFFQYLLPPELRQYYANDSTADYNNKDFLELCASKALICLDEFETPMGKNLSAFKSIVTKPTITLRRPYARYSSQLLHNASLCGTSNNIHIISEQETRRYLVWEVERIQSPRETPIDYRHLYAQALALGQKVMKEKTLSAASDAPESSAVDQESEPWVYWLTPKDISHLEVHNRLFIVNNYMEELIQKYYRVPNPDSDIHSPNLKFVTSAEILEHIAGNPVFRPSFSTRNVGDVMTHLGYSKTRRNNSHGWWVVEKEGVTIAADSRFIENKDEL